ncbi:signal peptidase II [Helicobacter brantae]|uniref:Lipoprotein signal peptidase n=1 Tax=Helicobacter brantae TaxID=375927 RepID=A0A3D8IZG7_9HELI|nr:signal peptidase II [Helicobacter brantae]RDU70672.1 lipoprotein signal peptidase [Helicobacter brantae]
MEESGENKIFFCPCNIYKNFKLYYGRVSVFLVLSIVCFVLDQYIKGLILGGYRYEGSVISIISVLNKGVAFSMFAFLGEGLKWIQVGLIFILAYVFLVSKDLIRQYFIPFGLLVGSGASNLYDRFERGGVVDYIFWHYKFEFAVFNLADVFINIGVGLLLLMIVFSKKKISV